MEITFSDEQIEIARASNKGLMVVGVCQSVDDELACVTGPCGIKTAGIIKQAIKDIAKAEGK